MQLGEAKFARVGGILHDSRGFVLAFFTSSIGLTEFNEVKLLQGGPLDVQGSLPRLAYHGR